MWAHRLAVITAAATFLLIFLGGVVTNTGSGLAVPDWPTTFGYNMFLYPLSGMVGGILYEHSHRLIGSAVGLLTILMAVGIWRAARRGWLRWLGVAAVAAVIAQGVLGGLRVVLLRQTLALLHGIFAQAFLGLIVGLAVCTSGRWAGGARRAGAGGDSPLRLCAVTTGLIFLQMAVGSAVTHTGALLHAHLLLGALVAIQVFWLAVRVLGRHGDEPWLARPVHLLAGLVIVQLFLGGGAYLSRFTPLGTGMPSALAIAFPVVHRLVGTLLLGTSLTLTLRASRRPGPSQPGQGTELISESGRQVAGPVSGRVPA